MNEMNSSNKDIYIKDIDDLEPNDSSNSKQKITTTTSSSLNTTTTTNTTSSSLKHIKIDYLNVPSMDNAFTVHRNNSLLKKTIQNRESIMNRNKLEKQKCFNNDELNTITVLNDDNNNNNNNNNTSDDDNYAIKSKEENINSKLNSISIVISPFIDDDDLNNNNNYNNNNEENINNKQEENKSQENHNLNIDLSIFELLDNSSKKFILKPVNMSLTIKSQVFRTKGMYPEYKFYLENFTDNLLLVMTARKRKKTKNTCYIINYISYDQTDIEKFIETPIAKLKSNLIGTQFVLYDFGIKPNKINENKHLLIAATGSGSVSVGGGGVGGQLGVHNYINEYDSSLSKTNSFDTNCSSDTESNDIQLLSSLRKEYLSISYELNFFGYKGPRQMFVIIPGMDNEFNREDFIVRTNHDTLLNSWKKLNLINKTQIVEGTPSTASNTPPLTPTTGPSTPITKNKKKNSIKKKSSIISQNSTKSSNNEDQLHTTTTTNLKTTTNINVVKLVNKSPVWHEQYKSFALNFNGRVTLPSVKNFQIIHEINPNYIVCQFGKVDTDLYTCDYSYPLCALQAFAISLSSLDNKLGCD